MAEYLLSGRSPSGRKVTERVEAGSADEAVGQLVERGFGEVVLHTDDTSALHSNQAAVEKYISAKEYVGMRSRRGPLRLARFVAWNFYAKNPILVIALVGLLGRKAWLGRPWGAWDGVCLLVLASPILLGLWAEFRGKSRRYNRLLEAASWGRWEEVLRLLPNLQGIGKPEELAFRRAQALAGLGRLDEGLAVVGPLADGSTIPEWYYWSRLPEVYFAAGRRDDMIAPAERAAELAPENATVLIELARLVAVIRRDVRRARALLDRARSHAISDVLAPFVANAEGIIALEERRFDDARGRFEAALKGIAPFSDSSPLMGVVVDTNRAWLALALAGQGDPIAAARLFKQAEPRLEALRSDHMLARCRREIGGFVT